MAHKHRRPELRSTIVRRPGTTPPRPQAELKSRPFADAVRYFERPPSAEEVAAAQAAAQLEADQSINEVRKDPRPTRPEQNADARKTGRYILIWLGVAAALATSSTTTKMIVDHFKG